MSYSDKDFTEGKLYKIVYYLYCLTLTSFYFIVANLILIVVVLFVSLAITKALLTMPTAILLIACASLSFGPAWVALLFVMKQVIAGEFVSITRAYMTGYRQHFRQSVIVNGLLNVLFLLTAVNYTIVIQIDSLSFLALPFLIVAALLGCLALYIFPLIIYHPTKLINLIKISFYFAVKKMSKTLVMLSMLVISYLLVRLFPGLFLLLVPGINGWLVMVSCRSLFEHINKHALA
ncbi:Uncharacterized membrane protein YesL [Amphibacillus marinus]|uniref:Uncharacterized membrane protein YesL n=1 Tax=Amphibacillus marinus TaxID=872970 RepID=A0A1H8IR97_9BACI|nr:DUF624 domain-containing protein [Amphibacillus marinus]SEN70625.1 Uncharacterized membrane protein YesL [Amphibacillus marinus]